MTIAAHLDFETYSELDLRKVGAWRYAEHPSTEVICAAVATNPHNVAGWLPGEPFPILLELSDETHAWNAEFEYAIWLKVCVRRYGWPVPDLRTFRCTMSLALSFGLPGKLEKSAHALGVSEQKDPRGQYLINKLCKPRPRVSKANPEPRWTWQTAPDDYRDMIAYNLQDVRTEIAVHLALPRPHLPPDEQETYYQSVRSSERGICIDAPSVRAIIEGVDIHVAKLEAEQRALTTTAATPNGIASGQIEVLRTWLREECGEALPNLQAETVRDVLERDLLDLHPTARRVLEIRQSTGQTSVGKFAAMERSCCSDGRIHGMLQYHGATTGRWAGRLVQLQNLKKPSNEIRKLKMADWIEMEGVFDPNNLELFGDPMAFFTAFVRPCLIASPGRTLLVADFNAIECRVEAWLANEQWLLDIFRAAKKGDQTDVYTIQASDLFKRPITKADEVEREIGKRIILGCGYQMGAPKYKETSKKYGAPCTLEFAQEAVDSYRRVNRRIVQFWYDLQDAAIEAIRCPGKRCSVRFLTFCASRRFLQMRLPSGRLLTYWYPRIEAGEFGPRIVYEGLNPVTKQWGFQDTYGGRLAENATQAVARDLCRDAILRMARADVGYDYLFSSHDEVVSEVPYLNASVDAYCRMMAEVPAWAEGCPIAAEGWAGTRYRK